MNQQRREFALNVRARAKFHDPEFTATGERRATVALRRPTTLWFNTGALCNIERSRCYIESSPANDRLVYISRAAVGITDRVGFSESLRAYCETIA